MLLFVGWGVGGLLATVLLGDSVGVHKQQCVAGLRNMTLEKKKSRIQLGILKPSISC